MKQNSFVWVPNPGSQVAFLTCPIFEVLYEGPRGNGKTEVLLVDFMREVGKGFGPEWQGILFRRTYDELRDVARKLQKIGYGVFGKEHLEFNRSKNYFQWSTGEILFLRFMDREDDYWKYHGHEYPWIAFEELTNWPDEKCYEIMKGTCRSSHPGMPRRYRATANPYGVGHGWIKTYFKIDQVAPGTIIRNKEGMDRTYLHGDLFENKPLLHADPQYVNNLRAIKDPNLRKAWFEGRWDIVAGGAIDDLWNPNVHLLKPFHIPSTWYVDRSFDWGEASPFSIGWWAEADGSPVKVWDNREMKYVWKTFPKGTLFRIAEKYGWNGKPNQGCKWPSSKIARFIREAEANLPYVVNPGAADSQIFTKRDGHSIADEMELYGVKWKMAYKSNTSRKTALSLFRQRLEASLKEPMEDPGIFIFETCTNFRRTVPYLQRDTKDMDDIDTTGEDHIWDDTMYRLNTERVRGGMVALEGI